MVDPGRAGMVVVVLLVFVVIMGRQLHTHSLVGGGGSRVGGGGGRVRRGGGGVGGFGRGRVGGTI